MITEIASLRIDPANAKAFEAAVAKAVPYFQTSKGCQGMALEAVIEEPGRYTLRVLWETVEAHTVDFRNSDNFQQWRALAGPFFVEPPVVVHAEAVATYF